MSFGASISPRYPAMPGKELHGYTKNHQSQKKFSYKQKTNKIPLRDKQRVEEEQQFIDESERAARLKANRALAERMKRERELKALQAARKHPKPVLKKGPTEPPADHVTLTQDQLTTILASIAQAQDVTHSKKIRVNFEGTTATEDQDHVKVELDRDSTGATAEVTKPNSATSLDLDTALNLAKTAVTPRERYTESTRKSNNDRSSQKKVVLNFNLNKKEEPKSSRTTKKSSNKSAPSYDEEKVFIRNAANVVIVDAGNESEPPEIPKIETDRMVIEPKVAAKPNHRKDEDALSPRQQLISLPRGHMTKAEKKRLEWELEKEAIEKLKAEQDKFARYFTKDTEAPQALNEPGKSNSNSYNDRKPIQDNRQALPSNQNDLAGTKQTKPASSNPKNSSRKSSVAVIEPSGIPGLEDFYSSNSNSRTMNQPQEQPSYSRSSQPPQQPNYNQQQSNYTQKQTLPNQVANAQQSARGQQQSAPAQAPQFLSKAELKRLQWEKEKAAAMPEYNPWGAPGGGVRPSNFGEAPPPDNTVNQPQLTANNVTTTTNVPQTTATTNDQPSNANPYKQHPQQYQAPISGVPTSLLGLENRPRLTNINPPVRTSLSKAELLKLKWAKEREQMDQDEHQEEYNPYGRPGCGAPIRTESGTVLNNYQSRLNYVLRRSQEKDVTDDTNDNSAPFQQQQELFSQQPITHPTEALVSNLDQSFNNHSRGQIVNLDMGTFKEREEVRKRELQHQEEIKRQVEEKQRIKREEQMKKTQEEAEEEAKMRLERNNQEQLTERKRAEIKQKEEKQMSNQDIVAEAIERAKREAEMLKARKRLEKLKAAGHDISHLQAAYEEKFSPRTNPQSTIPQETVESMLSPRSTHNQVLEPLNIPGLDLSPRSKPSPRYGPTDDTYTQRSLTPSKYKVKLKEKENMSPGKEFGVQTDDLEFLTDRRNIRKEEGKEKNIQKHVRVISGPKARKPKKDADPKPWGWKNQAGKNFKSQSKRDPFYSEKRERAEKNKQERTERLLKQVEANQRRIPLGKDRSESVGTYMSPRGEDNSSKLPPPKSTNTHFKLTGTEPTQTNRSTRPGGTRKKPSEVETLPNPNSGYNLTLARNLQVSPSEDFIPFLRSDVILSPRNAEEPPIISREQTQAALAREAYYKSMKPAQYGIPMHNIKDSNQALQARNKDPLYNPSLVTQHPTERQQQVLDSLRQMRMNLAARKRELEDMSPAPPSAV